jgi:hypothetical protein
MTFEFFEIDLSATLNSLEVAQETRTRIQNGGIGIVKHFITRPLAEDIRNYLITIGKSSLPTYQPIEVGRPNFHRLNIDDERSHVRGCFHQFVFYPWNQDVFGLFTLFDDLFRLKNTITGNPQRKYIGRLGEDGVVSRIAFQFYPAGKGFLNRHQDPFGEHQLTVPTVSFSDKFRDFQTGGAFVEDRYGARTHLDDVTEMGDVVFFDAQLVHGVELVDENAKNSWTDFSGRWTCLIATNKVTTNISVPDARDLDK